MWRAPKRPSRDTMYLERAGEEMSAPTHGKLHGELVRGRERCRGGRAVHGWAGASSWGGAHRLGSMFCTQEQAYRVVRGQLLAGRVVAESSTCSHARSKIGWL